MDIVCATDGNYLRHCVAMLESLWEHNPDADMHVYLIYDNVDSHKLSLAAGYLHSFLPGLSLMQASAKPLTGFPVSGHGSVAAYFRLLLPAMLPMSVERFVFIDADTIVVDSISPLWELSLEGRALADHAGAIGVDHQCFDPVQNRLVLRPSGNDGRLDAETAVIETFGEQLTTRIELVLAGSVAAATGKENNLVRRLRAESAGKGNPNREKQGFCMLYHGGST